jgi:hypothetical protein
MYPPTGHFYPGMMPGYAPPHHKMVGKQSGTGGASSPVTVGMPTDQQYSFFPPSHNPSFPEAGYTPFEIAQFYAMQQMQQQPGLAAGMYPTPHGHMMDSSVGNLTTMGMGVPVPMAPAPNAAPVHMSQNKIGGNQSGVASGLSTGSGPSHSFMQSGNTKNSNFTPGAQGYERMYYDSHNTGSYFPQGQNPSFVNSHMMPQAGASQQPTYMPTRSNGYNNWSSQ